MREIRIRNLSKCEPLNPYDFIVDRRTPLGNPYRMADESDRDHVVNKYATWFARQIETTNRFEAPYLYLRRIRRALAKYGRVNLYCWCFPKRCHANIIREYLIYCSLFETRRNFCQVPGCRRKWKVGWNPRGHLRFAAKVCRTHLRKNNDPKDDFALWKFVSVQKEDIFREIERGKAVKKRAETTDDHPKRVGRVARRSAEIAFRSMKCDHPYKCVRYDKVFATARCLRCGKQVKRIRKGSDKYKTRSKPHKMDRQADLSDISIQTAMNMFFFEYTTVDTTWKQAVSLARRVKPGTRFSTASFNWYRNNFLKNVLNRKEDSKMPKRKKKKEAAKKPKKKTAEKKGAKKKSIAKAMYEYFDEVGVDEAKYEKALKSAKRIKPDTAFNKAHFSYYKGQYLER